jgi:hypothetical protein
MAYFARWLALIVAPLMLTSCLLVPAKFTSSLDIRADRTFTFTYVGEVQLLKSSKETPDDGSSGFEDTPNSSEQSWREEEGDGEPRMIKIADKPKAKAKAKGKASARDDDFGDSPEEATKLKQLVQTLSGEYGFRSVRYIGSRKLAIDYRITGKLDHAFIFPFNPDGEIIVPFIAVELRGKDRLRVKAPGFANDESSAGSMGMGRMGGMGGMGGGGSPGSELDGTFTLTTTAEVVSQNQEEGAQVAPDGGKKIVWTVNPNTRDAPMAVLRVNALP